MPIDFAPKRWAQIRSTYRQWWASELERPIIPIGLVGRDPGRPVPDAPLLSQQGCADWSVSPAALIDRIDYELLRKVFLGDAFPWVNRDVFGPGVAAALARRCSSSLCCPNFRPPASACRAAFTISTASARFATLTCC